MTIGEELKDMSNAGSRILRSVSRARAYARGETSEGFVAHVPAEVDVKAIRTKLGLSQEGFGRRFGFSPAAVRDWEQHRRQPEQAARVLLLVIDRNPEAVYEALTGAVVSQPHEVGRGLPRSR
jgi:putative transcriptional regulator